MGKKKTTEQFIEELKMINPEITILGEYVNNKTKIEVQHTCGYQWNPIPNALLQGSSCPRCTNIKRAKVLTKSTPQFIEELKMINPEITVLDEYVNNKVKIKVQHTCGYQWKAIPINLLRGVSCPKCARVINTKSTQQFIEELKMVNPEITVLGEYVNNKVKIKVQHTCGNKWEATPINLLQGTSCPECFGTILKTTQQFIEELKVINPEITVLGEYVNNKVKIKVQHTCGWVWRTLPSSLLQGKSCPECFGTILKTTQQFIEELKVINPEITILGKYINNNTKIEVQHTCEWVWRTLPLSLLQGSSCPKCNESKGEKFLSKILTENKIPFISQFNLLKNPKTNYWLRSDFAILDKDKNPLLILEYDGIQHFKSVDYFGGDEALKSTQERDALKDNYCKANNIPYLRFSYLQSELEIHTLLLKELRKLS